jgi:ribosomal protein S18 acetylase RimI-like enzyme
MGGGEATLRWIDNSGPLYAAELDLRFRVLREPLGMGRHEVQGPWEDVCRHLVALEAGGAGERSGRVVACVLWREQSPGVARLFQMAVDPDWQGRGLGARMVRDLERDARERGCPRVVMHARETAIGFYESLGYEGRGERFTEVGIPHRIMERRIDGPESDPADRTAGNASRATGAQGDGCPKPECI